MTCVQPAGMLVATKQPSQILKGAALLTSVRALTQALRSSNLVTQKWIATADLAVNEDVHRELPSHLWMLRHLRAKRF